MLLAGVSGWELGVFETMQGSGAPPGGLPLHSTPLHSTPLHSTLLHLRSPTCCSQRAQRRSSVEPGLWEDEGRPRGRRERNISRMRRGTRTPDAAAGPSDPLRRNSGDSEASRMFFSDGTLSAVTCALLLGITCLTALCDLTKGSADFSGQKTLCTSG